jgi:hypothetical protein
MAPARRHTVGPSLAPTLGSVVHAVQASVAMQSSQCTSPHTLGWRTIDFWLSRSRASVVIQRETFPALGSRHALWQERRAAHSNQNELRRLSPQRLGTHAPARCRALRKWQCCSFSLSGRRPLQPVFQVVFGRPEDMTHKPCMHAAAGTCCPPSRCNCGLFCSPALPVIKCAA